MSVMEKVVGTKSMESLVAAIEKMKRVPSEGPEGFTAKEAVQLTGMGLDVVRKRIRELSAAGQLECVGTRREFRVDGRPSPTPVYRLVKGKK